MTEQNQRNESLDAGARALGEALQTSFRLLRWLVVGLLFAYLLSGLFIVRQHERALVLKLGRVAGLGAERVKEPGLHWTWPRPIARVLRVPAGRVQTIATSSFWHRQSPEFQEESTGPVGATLNPELDGYLLTGDANILHARWALRFTISDPERWAFQLQDPESVLLRALDAAVVRQAARQPIDRALRSDVAGLREAVEREVVARVRALDAGVQVQGLDLIDLAPPPQVAQAFDAVIQAEQQRGTRISEARAAAARTLSAAAGEAARRRAEGATDQRRLLSEIEGDADRFRQMQASYARNADVFMETLRQDSIRRVLNGAEQKYFVRGGRTVQEWRLHVGPETRKPADTE